MMNIKRSQKKKKGVNLLVFLNPLKQLKEKSEPVQVGENSLLNSSASVSIIITSFLTLHNLFLFVALVLC